MTCSQSVIVETFQFAKFAFPHLLFLLVNLKSIENTILKFYLNNVIQWFPKIFSTRSTSKILVVAKHKKTIGIVFRGPLEQISQTTSGPRSRLWELLRCNELCKSIFSQQADPDPLLDQGQSLQSLNCGTVWVTILFFVFWVVNSQKLRTTVEKFVFVK